MITCFQHHIHHSFTCLSLSKPVHAQKLFDTITIILTNTITLSTPISFQASCKRFVSQLLNLALRAAKKYDERETVTWMNQIAKYTVFISSAVDADGNLFKEVSKLLSQIQGT